MRHPALVTRWFAGTALLAIARPAMAHGEEVLLLPVGNVVALLVVAIAALGLKIGWASRLVAILVAVGVALVPYFVTNQYIPYWLSFSESVPSLEAPGGTACGAMKKKRKTAAELRAELERDPEHAIRMRRDEEERRRLAEEYRQEAAPVLTDLAAAGFDVSTIGDLRRWGREYREAIPVLLSWLPRSRHAGVREDIVRMLSVPFARPAAASALLSEFRRTGPTDGALRWAIGNGLEVVADDSVFDAVVEIAENPHYGKAREMFAVALGNMRTPRAVDVLLGLLRDHEVAGHAIMGLGKLAAPRARHEIEPFLGHPKPWIRKEAERAIARIDKAARRSR